MIPVDVCPKNQTEVNEAANRLKCSYDEYGNSRYLCLPKSDKTSHVEFCYDGIMVLQEKGNCLQSFNGNLTLSSCLRFYSGCPKIHFRSSEFYKYPACQNLDREHHCYLMDPSCPPKSDENASHSQVVYGYVYGCIALAIIITAICFLLWKRREQNREINEETTESVLEDRESRLRTTFGSTGDVCRPEQGPLMLTEHASSLFQRSSEAPYQDNACASDMFCDTAESLQTVVQPLDESRYKELHGLLNHEGIIQDALRLVIRRSVGKTPEELLSDETIKSKLKTELPEERHGVLFCHTEAGKSVDVLYGLIRLNSGEQPNSGWGNPVMKDDSEISDDVERLHRIYSIHEKISYPVTITEENYVRLLNILVSAVNRLDRDSELEDKSNEIDKHL